MSLVSGMRQHSRALTRNVSVRGVPLGFLPVTACDAGGYYSTGVNSNCIEVYQPAAQAEARLVERLRADRLQQVQSLTAPVLTEPVVIPNVSSASKQDTKQSAAAGTPQLQDSEQTPLDGSFTLLTQDVASATPVVDRFAASSSRHSNQHEFQYSTGVQELYRTASLDGPIQQQAGASTPSPSAASTPATSAVDSIQQVLIPILNSTLHAAQEKAQLGQQPAYPPWTVRTQEAGMSKSVDRFREASYTVASSGQQNTDSSSTFAEDGIEGTGTEQRSMMLFGDIANVSNASAGEHQRSSIDGASSTARDSRAFSEARKWMKDKLEAELRARNRQLVNDAWMSLE